MKYLILNILFFFAISNLFAAEECDSVRHCYGNRDRALTFTQSFGQGAHYVDVDKTPSQNTITNQLTLEMRIKAQRQAGKKQFIAGLWGPAEDVNDVWTAYIDENDMLVFEINGNANLGQTDNTIAEISYSPYYDSWQFLTLVFDGNTQSAKIYLNGNLEYESRNNQYPVTQLKQLQNDELEIQIGSTNALSNEPAKNRTFLGQLDEIRLWNIALDENDIYCYKDKSLNGNEDNLIMYWRCNQDEGVYDICDATPNGNTGRARSGAQCMESDWRFNKTIFLEPIGLNLENGRIKDTISCVESKNYRFRVIDTSSCNKSVYIRMWNDLKDNYSYSTRRIDNMEKGVYYDFEVTLDADFTGTINSRILVYRLNRCQDWNQYWMDITRITDTEMDMSDVDFGLLKANCIEKPYEEHIFEICNNTSKTGNPRNITISDISTTMPDVFMPMINPNQIIPPGECLEIPVRFISGDTSAVYTDTLTIVTDDACDPIKKIALTGEVKEVISIFNNEGERIDTIDFEDICLDFASDPYNFYWRNLLEDEDIIIENIIIPNQVKSVAFKFPITLEPNNGDLPEYFRFYPEVIGNMQDSIIFIIKSGECTIERKIYVFGEGKKIDAEFINSNLNFGNVFIGTESKQDVEIQNNSNRSITLRLYTKKGEVFFINGSRIVSIPANSTKTIEILFRPVSDTSYTDELCFFDVECYNSNCINLTGSGVWEKFIYEPEILKIENVIGCEKKSGTISIRNNLSQGQVLTDIQLIDPNGKFKIISPANIPPNVNLPPNGEFIIEVEYNPNDISSDRADKAFIEYKVPGDTNIWHTKIEGYSITPSIFVTANTSYGKIEFGDTKSKIININNLSPVPIRIDSITIPQGFIRLSPPLSFDGSYIQPEEEIELEIEFNPTNAGNYSGNLIIHSSDPCIKEFTGNLEGEAEIIPLEIPLTVVSFGYINPCECENREILMINRSQLFPMTIDSILINGIGLNNAKPEFFSWTTKYYEQNGNNLPYEIPANEIDTLQIIYCPESLSYRDSLVHSANVNIYASGSGWENDFSSYLTGKRALLIDPLKYEINFPPTRVDTFSVPQYSQFYSPDINLNPLESKIKIDSIYFIPDERVFYLDSIGLEFPIYMDNLDSIITKLQFKPRAVREYEARMVFRISEPCNMEDSTVIVRGSGFAPAFGLSFTFENPDTDTIPIFHTVHCDTLEIPLYSSRKFPAELVDMDVFLDYDTTIVDFAGIETKYLNQNCDNYVPNFTIDDSSFSNTRIFLKNFCNVDSIDPVFIAKFIPKYNRRDTFDITIDSLFFDTEEVILYEIIAEIPTAKAIIDLTEISILNEPDFGIVNVLDCKRDTLLIRNTGDNPTDISEIFDYPEDIKIISSNPNFNTPIFPGDTALILLEYCPTNNDKIDTIISAESSFPCIVNDSIYLYGQGFAPDYEVSADISQKFSIPDTISGTIGDTITIPIFFEKDLSVLYNNQTYYMLDLSFKINFLYNKRALKYLSHNQFTNGDLISNVSNGNIELNFSGVDSLKAGKIAELDFLITVPDSVISTLAIKTNDFKTEHIMFYNLLPYNQEGFFETLSKCDISYLNFTDISGTQISNAPNPFSNITEFEFTTQERANIILSIYNINGEKISELLDGSIEFEPGTYNLKFNSIDISSGVYLYRFQAGTTLITDFIIKID